MTKMESTTQKTLPTIPRMPILSQVIWAVDGRNQFWRRHEKIKMADFSQNIHFRAKHPVLSLL